MPKPMGQRPRKRPRKIAELGVPSPGKGLAARLAANRLAREAGRTASEIKPPSAPRQPEWVRRAQGQGGGNLPSKSFKGALGQPVNVPQPRAKKVAPAQPKPKQLPKPEVKRRAASSMRIRKQRR